MLRENWCCCYCHCWYCCDCCLCSGKVNISEDGTADQPLMHCCLIWSCCCEAGMCSRGRVKYPPCAQVRIGTKHVYDGNEQGESEVPPVHNFMMAVSMCSVFLVAVVVWCGTTCASFLKSDAVNEILIREMWIMLRVRMNKYKLWNQVSHQILHYCQCMLIDHNSGVFHCDIVGYEVSCCWC